MSNRFRKLKNQNLDSQKEAVSYMIEDVEEITDEIEKALIAIKENLDLPTEEIEKSIESRRRYKFSNMFDKTKK